MNNEISLQQAIDMTTLFRAEKDNIVNPKYAGQNILPDYETFDRAIFDSILAKPGCVGFRIYSGLNSQLQLRSVFCGVDSKNMPILPPSSDAAKVDGGGYIGEDGQSCPPICAPSSPLNP